MKLDLECSRWDVKHMFTSAVDEYARPRAMIIPTRLADCLSRNQALQASVLLSCQAFTPWLTNSGMPFFPEFTDHGPAHLEAVAVTAASIITDNAYNQLTAEDAAVLLLAILLHDSAMHLSEDGFRQLINSNTVRPIISGFGDRPWVELWDEFRQEASRYDAQKLKALFGDSMPVNRPSDDSETWTKRDRRLIGEFLRRHHPRLAHEISRFGVPGPGSDPLTLKELDSQYADLAGLVARSHGYPLRVNLKYLEENYDKCEYRGVHAIFLMVILRIADYVQLQSERAPRTVLKVKALRSPISMGEWTAHHAIQDIRTDRLDPEALRVDALPSDVITYHKVRHWLNGIQSELDVSWAVLGEVYGLQSDLRQLALVLRRVRSNMDDVEVFAKKIEYIPCKASFQAHPDVLKLMIRPLYGDQPKYGVRELLQNAVDAVRERWAYKGIPVAKSSIADDDSDVSLALETDSEEQYWLIIQDKGIGMTADTIIDYFLTAGASFRTSDTWNRHFSDSCGKSNVLRVGRFGVGVLAAFLISDEIEVATRHVDADDTEGIRFIASINSNDIELRRCCDPPLPVGTTIRMRISRSFYDELVPFELASGLTVRFGDDPADWYHGSKPALSRILIPQNVRIESSYQIPGPGDVLPDGWRRIKPTGYSEVHWTYGDVPALCCNGFKVLPPENPWGGHEPMLQRVSQWSIDDATLPVHLPNISVFDPDGMLPLNLQRTGVTQEHYPFDRDLLVDVLKDFLAWLLVNSPQSLATTIHGSRALHTCGYAGAKNIRTNGTPGWPRFFVTTDGTALLDPWNLEAAGIRALVIAPGVPGQSLLPTIINDGAVGLTIADMGPEHPLVPREVGTFHRGNVIVAEWINFSLGLPSNSYRGGLHNPLAELSPVGRRVWVSQPWAEQLSPDDSVNVRSATYYNGRWAAYEIGECGMTCIEASSLDRMIATQETKEVLPGLITEWYFSSRFLQVSSSTLREMWREVLRMPIIPFSETERRRILAGAFEQLDDYVKAHEQHNKSKNINRIQSSGGLLLDSNFRWSGLDDGFGGT